MLRNVFEKNQIFKDQKRLKKKKLWSLVSERSPLFFELMQTRTKLYKVEEGEKKVRVCLWPRAGSILTPDIIDNITLAFSLKTQVLSSSSSAVLYFPFQFLLELRCRLSEAAIDFQVLSAAAAAAPAATSNLHLGFSLCLLLSFLLCAASIM